MEKTHWKKKFNYDYLGSYSIEDGKDLILTIKEVLTEQVTGDKGRKEDCLVCHFAEDVKPMILNRTNCKMIQKAHGSGFIEDWPGKKVQIYIKQNVEAFGESVEALRIRPKAPAENKPDLLPGTDTWKKTIKRLATGTTIDTVEKHYKLTESNRDQLLDEAMNETTVSDKLSL